MLVKELVEKINFNDSCVNGLVYTDGIVKLDIDLCMWKQAGYQEGTPELKNVVLCFLDITNYNWDSDKKENEIYYDSIIDIAFEKGVVKIVLEDDDVSVLTFMCREVSIES